MSDPKTGQDEIDSTAAAWTARLGRCPLSPAERRDLDLWLRESPLHAAAFKEAQSAWSKMGQLRFTQEHRTENRKSKPDSPGSTRSLGPAWARQTRHRLQAAALAACLLLFFGAGLFLWLGNPKVLVTTDYRTAPGELDQISLPDGSLIELGPASAVAVQYTPEQRRVRLVSGLAYFVVAASGDGEARPFVVATTKGSARALGTRFTVGHKGESVEVTVVEHAVEVAATSPDGEVARVLVSQGQAVRYRDAGLGEVRTVNPDHSTAWRRGRLIFDHMPLAEVVAELNRYRRGRIVITDPNLASRQVSGVFSTDDPQAVLATVVRDLDIEAVSLTPLLTLLH